MPKAVVWWVIRKWSCFDPRWKNCESLCDSSSVDHHSMPVCHLKWLCRGWGTAVQWKDLIICCEVAVVAGSIRILNAVMWRWTTSRVHCTMFLPMTMAELLKSWHSLPVLALYPAFECFMCIKHPIIGAFTSVLNMEITGLWWQAPVKPVIYYHFSYLGEYLKPWEFCLYRNLSQNHANSGYQVTSPLHPVTLCNLQIWMSF